MIIFHDFLSHEECSILIDYIKYKHINSSNNLVSGVLPNMASYYTDRLISCSYKPVCEDVRYSCYYCGTVDKHQDWKIPNKIYVLLIYLNDVVGGETLFYDEDGTVTHSIKPKPGKAVVFDGAIYHSANEILSHPKYILTCDLRKY